MLGKNKTHEVSNRREEYVVLYVLKKTGAENGPIELVSVFRSKQKKKKGLYSERKLFGSKIFVRKRRDSYIKQFCFTITEQKKDLSTKYSTSSDKGDVKVTFL